MRKSAAAVTDGNQVEKQLALLSKITDSIAYNLNLEDVLREIVDVVFKETKADSILLYVFEEPEAKLVLRASKNPHPKLLGKISLKFGEGITGWVAQHKTPVEISEKAWEDHRFKLFNTLPEDKYEAFLSLPITFQQKLVGVVNVQYRKPKKHNSGQIDLLSTLTKLVGGAIENARLVQESQALKDALAARKTIDRAKGLLIKKRHMTEPEAYNYLQNLAMKHRKSLKEVAEAMIMILESGKIG